MPRIILIRHGMAQHNVLPMDMNILDPLLTPTGHKQALSLSSRYPTLYESISPESTLLISSPLRRTVQTTLRAFGGFVDGDLEEGERVKMLFLPQLQELGSMPCDTGADLDSTRKLFPHCDFSLCTPGWNSNKGFYASTLEAQSERARWVRRWLREREEELVIVVSHHGFLRTLCGIPRRPGVIQWGNAEAREYAFKDPIGGEEDDAELERVVDAVL